MKTRGMGGVYRRGQVWWIRYWFRGLKHCESSTSIVRADAVKLLRRRHAEMGRGRLMGPDADKTTFENLATMLVEDYRMNGRKSVERVNTALKHLRSYFGRSHAQDITSDRITSYVRSRLDDPERPAKPATIRNELAALGRMFTLGLRSGRVAYRPILPALEVRNTRAGFFEEPELRSVVARLPEHLRGLVEFCYLTGWRVGEVKGLSWRQVDFVSGMVRLEPGTTKNDEGRTFPFAALPALAAVLQRERERTAALERELGQIIPWVFHRRGKPIHSFRDAWLKACREAGVCRLVHDLRRTAVRNLERAGVPRSWAMKLTGHKTESIYRRYAIVSEADLSEGVRRLAGLQIGGGSPRTGTVPVQFGRLAAEAASAELGELVEAVGAGGGGRTHTRGEPNGILSRLDPPSESRLRVTNRANPRKLAGPLLGLVTLSRDTPP